MKGYHARAEDEWTGRTDMSAAQRKRIRRRMRGWCVCCNQPAVAGRSHCEKHRLVVNAAARERYRAIDAAYQESYGMSRYSLAKLRRLGPRIQGRRLI